MFLFLWQETFSGRKVLGHVVMLYFFIQGTAGLLLPAADKGLHSFNDLTVLFWAF